MPHPVNNTNRVPTVQVSPQVRARPRLTRAPNGASSSSSSQRRFCGTRSSTAAPSRCPTAHCSRRSGSVRPRISPSLVCNVSASLSELLCAHRLVRRAARPDAGRSLPPDERRGDPIGGRRLELAVRRHRRQRLAVPHLRVRPRRERATPCHPEMASEELIVGCVGVRRISRCWRMARRWCA